MKFTDRLFILRYALEKDIRELLEKASIFIWNIRHNTTGFGKFKVGQTVRIISEHPSKNTIGKIARIDIFANPSICVAYYDSPEKIGTRYINNSFVNANEIEHSNIELGYNNVFEIKYL